MRHRPTTQDRELKHKFSALCLPILLISATAARADCASEFAEANQWKVAAGPYRMVMHETVINELDGKKYPKELLKQVYQFAPPDAIHIKDTSQ